jgi:hypothetical protein
MTSVATTELGQLTGLSFFWTDPFEPKSERKGYVLHGNPTGPDITTVRHPVNTVWGKRVNHFARSSRRKQKNFLVVPVTVMLV